MPTLKIQRRKEFINAMRRYRIYLDGEKVASVANGQSINLDLSSGAHNVTAKIYWCSSPTISFDIAGDELIKMNVAAFKYSSWIIPIGIWVVLSIFALNMIWESSYYGLFALPMAALSLYYITLGRKKYLTLELLETEQFTLAEPAKFSA